MSELEMFERILEMASSAGEGAFWLAVLYIGKSYFTSILTFVFLSIVFLVVFKLARQHFMESERWDQLREIARPGTGFGTVLTSEYNTIKRLVIKGKEYENQRDSD